MRTDLHRVAAGFLAALDDDELASLTDGLDADLPHAPQKPEVEFIGQPYNTTFLAFVTIPPARATRVRFDGKRRACWRCDTCGRGPRPCRHAAAASAATLLLTGEPPLHKHRTSTTTKGVTP